MFTIRFVVVVIQLFFFFFFQAEDGIRDLTVTGVQTCALPISSRTLDRLLDVFPVDQQDQIRIMVSESLRGIISQQLVPTANNLGRVLALETLTNTPAVANVIREAKTYMLPGIIQTGTTPGMQLMDH